MPRPLKKFIYGVFYFSIIILIVFLVYEFKLKAKPTCFDKIQNQNEEGIDCGGICGACRILQLKNPEKIGEIKIMSSGAGKTILLTEIKNPNADYGISQFNYSFQIYGKDDILLQTINGDSDLFPNESKYLYSAEVADDEAKIEKIVLEFERVKWLPAYDYVKPEFPVAQKLTTEVTDGSVKVMGIVRNESPVEIKNLNLIAVLYDRFGIEVFAAQTLVSDLAGFSEKSFVVNFPKDFEFSEKTDKEKTKIFMSFNK